MSNGGSLSNIKYFLDTWYNNNLQAYDSMITSTPGFCNDRVYVNGSTLSDFNFNAFTRLVTNKNPSLKCEYSEDLYIIKIGLITADEMSFAGGLSGTGNSNYYLYGPNYWTMSPYSYFNGGWADMFLANGGAISNGTVDEERGVRPVINLSADTTIKSGNGTISSVYEISD